MTSRGNQHCSNCIGTLSFPIITPYGSTYKSSLQINYDHASYYAYFKIEYKHSVGLNYVH